MMKSTPSSTCTASCSSKVLRTRSAAGGAAGFVHPGEAEIARDQALVAGNFACDAHGGAIQFFEPVLEADRGQFVAAGVEGQRLQNIGAGFAKLDMQFAQRVWDAAEQLRE